MPHKLAFIVPTKDRREDLTKLLDSFKAQSRRPDQIVIVDGGDDTVDDLVASHPELPIDYLRVYPPGFTKQKNAGTAALKPDMTLVGYLDDDIVLDPDALEKLMEFWEKADPDVGGTEFHIWNMSPVPASFGTRFFGTNDGSGGKIMPSGFSIILWPVERDTEVEWLCGGATVWRREIVDDVLHDEWFAGYGHMDDIDYSCMVSGKWRMFVLADARCAHYERPIPMEKDYVFGIYDTVNRHYLVTKYPERFSKLRFYWATVGKVVGRFMVGVVKRDKGCILRARGYGRGLIKVLRGDSSLSDVQVK